MCSSDLTCKWYGLTIPFHKLDFFKDKESLCDILTIPSARVAHLDQESHAATAVTRSIDTTESIPEVVKAQTHLSEQQRADLLHALSKFPKLFDGSLGLYPKQKFHIELKEGAVPYHVRGPYSVPVQNLPVLKQELEWQCVSGFS